MTGKVPLDAAANAAINNQDEIGEHWRPPGIKQLNVT
jgi:hypothetical protein